MLGTRKHKLADFFLQLACILSWSIGGVLFGCSKEEPKVDKKTPRASYGVIAAVQSDYVVPGNPVPFEQFQLTGMFAKYDVTQRSRALSFLMSKVPAADMPFDTCSSPAPVIDSANIYDQLGSGAIELLDVGDLSVRYKRNYLPVPTRTFPDLLKVIVGVIYTADKDYGVVYEPGSVYNLKTTGNEGVVEPFEVVLEAPDPLGSLLVNETPPEEQTPIVQRKKPAKLQWEGLGFGDEVVASLNWTNMGAPWSMTCRMKDDGDFTIPARLTRFLPDPLTASDEEMTIARVRRVSFRASGLSGGSFNFVVRSTFIVAF